MSMLFLTFGEILAMPFMNAYWIGRTVQNNRGQYAALYSVAWASAQAAGPYTGSLVAEYMGYKMLWFIISAVCLFLAFFTGDCRRPGQFRLVKRNFMQSRTRCKPA